MLRRASLCLGVIIFLFARFGVAAEVCVDARNSTGVTDGSASHPYTTITAAVAAAASGDTVKVARGHYQESVWVNGKSLSLIGGFVGATAYGSAPGDFTNRDPEPSLTWIEGSSSAPVLRLTDAPQSVVDGFRISHGRRGIQVDAFAWPWIVTDIEVIGCLIEVNGVTDQHGGGIDAVGANLTIRGNTIRQNIGNNFAGLWVHACSNVLIEDNLVEGNIGHGDHGGGVAINGWGTLRNNVIRANRIGETVGYGWGGGVIVIEEHDQPTLLTGNVISGNHAPSSGGGVFVDEGATATLLGELIVSNTGPASGGGVYVDASWDGRRSHATISGCTIADNTSVGWPGWGAGVFAQESDVVILDSILWNNVGLGGYDDFAVVDGGTITGTYTLSREGLAGTGNLSVDPEFANPVGLDYHLKSRTGRWDPALASWIADGVHSPAIDAGDPSSEYEFEPVPNGARRNLGAFGNTAQASMSWPATSYLLTVSRAGTGVGTVTSHPPGIDCGSICTAGFAAGQLVTLTASPGLNSFFAGWAGACSGLGVCEVTMDGAKGVTATFEPLPPLVAVRPLVDLAGGSTADGNGVLEPGEQVILSPIWHNPGPAGKTVTGTISGLTGPPGATYTIVDGTASYGVVPAGGDAHPHAATGNAYAISVSSPASRPAAHWDIQVTETLSTGETRTWTVHVGDSFADVPRSHWAYRFIETIFHNRVTSGCNAAPFEYCPGSTLTRAQMAVLLLMARHGPAWVPPAPTGTVFVDVPPGHWAAAFIEALVAAGITSGCDVGMYCPDEPITRAQMAVFLLMAKHGPGYVPPPSTGLVFTDVPIDHWAGDFIEELAAEGITGGCGPGVYCPDGIVTRAEMAVFLTATFGLQLGG